MTTNALRIELDDATRERLHAAAARELRPVHFQAIIALRRGLGMTEDEAYRRNTELLVERQAAKRRAAVAEGRPIQLPLLPTQ